MNFDPNDFPKDTRKQMDDWFAELSATDIKLVLHQLDQALLTKNWLKAQLLSTFVVKKYAAISVMATENAIKAIEAMGGGSRT